MPCNIKTVKDDDVFNVHFFHITSTAFHITSTLFPCPSTGEDGRSFPPRWKLSFTVPTILQNIHYFQNIALTGISALNAYMSNLHYPPV